MYIFHFRFNPYLDTSFRTPLSKYLCGGRLTDPFYVNIGLFTSVYHLWGRARRPYCDDWELANDRRYFAAGTGRSASDVVWRQAAKAEAECQDSQHAAVFLWDTVSIHFLLFISTVCIHFL